MTQPANLLIVTPAYGGQVHVDYVSSLLVFQRQGIVFTLMTIGKRALITRAQYDRLDVSRAPRNSRTCCFLDGDAIPAARWTVAHDRVGKDVVGARWR
jgi:hypothetical protein